MDSILTSIKKLLGIAEDYEHFDADIIIHINSVLMVLTQLGIGPTEGFAIEDENAKWNDFVPDTSPFKMKAIQTYIYLRVRLLFDPPQSGTVIQMINNQIAEYEWRLNAIAESTVKSESDSDSDVGDVPDGSHSCVIDKDAIVNAVLEALPYGDEVKY